MKNQTGSFLKELYNLMIKYEADIEVSEGIMGFEVSVVDPDEGYSETVYIYSKILDFSIIEGLLND